MWSTSELLEAAHFGMFLEIESFLGIGVMEVMF